MLDIILDTLIDGLKLLPFLFLTYILLELIEKKASSKTEEIIKKSGKFGPVLGAILGIVPQCGFSAAASSLYSAGIISLGTLLAIFLSTSDEMLPILISKSAPIGIILNILALKASIGIISGIIIDIIRKNKSKKNNIHEICKDDDCNCENEGVLKSAIHHTLHIFIYIFVITLVLNIIIYFIGEESIVHLILNIPIIGPLISTFVGLIPNCASSVILTTLYLDNIISMGSMLAGLLANSGIGLLVLFRLNKDKKENLKIVLLLIIIGVVSGIIVDLII